MTVSEQPSGRAHLSDLYRTNRRAIITVAAAIAGLFLFTFPFYGSSYQLTQIGALSMVLGIMALSMVFLAGYGGLVSLAQVAIAGAASYTIGIMTVNHSYPLWQAVPMAVLVATLVAFLFGVISVRTSGIYFLMITLALAEIIYNITLENYSIFNGHGGIGGERAPVIGGLSFDPIKSPRSFYYLALVTAFVLYVGLRYVTRTPFGLALQGVRDNPRRMRALGFWVEGHRVASFTLAGFIAGVGGVLYVWYYAQINPTFIDLPHTINILIIAVIGGLIYLEGAFVGALAFTLVTNFASSYTDRYNSVIGLTFLLIVMYSPDGLVGLPQLVFRLLRSSAGLRGRDVRGVVAAGDSHQSSEPALVSDPSSTEEVDGGIQATTVTDTRD